MTGKSAVRLSHPTFRLGCAICLLGVVSNTLHPERTHHLQPIPASPECFDCKRGHLSLPLQPGNDQVAVGFPVMPCACVWGRGVLFFLSVTAVGQVLGFFSLDVVMGSWQVSAVGHHPTTASSCLLKPKSCCVTPVSQSCCAFPLELRG